VKYVIGTVLDFNPVNDCPLWLALIHDATDKSRVNLYNQWQWLTPDDILALQYHLELSKQKILFSACSVPVIQETKFEFE
jgi:hypothetical protein